jgi:Uma2 family endonuclease
MSATESIVIPRKIWTRIEVDRLLLNGLSLELVNGELLDRMGKKPPHVYWKTILGGWLREMFGDEYVRSEDPIDVAPEDNPTSEPEPDLIVTYQSIHVTHGINPKPADLRLVVEVSDATYEYDTNIKAQLYARAGICEFWVLDVREVD